MIEDDPATTPEQTKPGTGPSHTATATAVLPDAPRRRGSRVLWVASALLFVSALAATGVAASYRYAESVIQPTRKHVGGLNEVEPGAPVNILVVGSDSRAGLSAKELADARTQPKPGGDGQLADTIILIHVSPARKKAVMVSFPRDLKVQVHGRTAKINSAFADGPEGLVKVVQETTGLDVNHYVEVNFTGFLRLVDKLGGVRLCNRTGKTLDDKDSGLHMAPGCRVVSGPGALAFVRARKIDSDFGRMERQQQFARAVMDKLADRGNLVNLPRLTGIARVLSSNVKTDDGLAPREALGLARRIGSLRDEDVDMRIYPSVAVPPACGGCPAYVEALPEARLLMRALAHDDVELPPVGRTGRGADNVTLRGVSVMVRNASGVQGRATKVARALKEDFGLNAVPVRDAKYRSGYPLKITYPASLAQQARLLELLLGGGANMVQAGSADPRHSLVMTVGNGWQPWQ